MCIRDRYISYHFEAYFKLLSLLTYIRLHHKDEKSLNRYVSISSQIDWKLNTLFFIRNWNVGLSPWLRNSSKCMNSILSTFRLFDSLNNWNLIIQSRNVCQHKSNCKKLTLKSSHVEREITRLCRISWSRTSFPCYKDFLKFMHKDCEQDSSTVC